MVWYSIDNMLQKISEGAGICPYYSNHSLRVTTVTVLSSKKVETRQIKAVTGHRNDASIQSYFEDQLSPVQEVVINAKVSC